MKKTIEEVLFERRTVTVGCAWSKASMAEFGNSREATAWCTLDGEWAITRPASIKFDRAGERKRIISRSKWMLAHYAHGMYFSTAKSAATMDALVSEIILYGETWRAQAKITHSRWVERSMTLGD